MPHPENDGEVDHHKDNLVCMPASTETHWRQFLSEFNERVWPVFKEHGISKDAALLTFISADIHDSVMGLEDLIEQLTERLSPHDSGGTDEFLKG